MHHSFNDPTLVKPKVWLHPKNWDAQALQSVEENEISTSLLLGVDFKTYGKMARESS